MRVRMYIMYVHTTHAVRTVTYITHYLRMRNQCDQACQLNLLNIVSHRFSHLHISYSLSALSRLCLKNRIAIINGNYISKCDEFQSVARIIFEFCGLIIMNLYYHLDLD